jgi:hypothetical protein
MSRRAPFNAWAVAPPCRRPDGSSYHGVPGSQRETLFFAQRVTTSDRIVDQRIPHGLVQETHLTVDATYLRANAPFKSMGPVVVAMRPVIDHVSSIIPGTEASRPDHTAEGDTTLCKVRRVRWRFPLLPITVGADKGYRTGTFGHYEIADDLNGLMPPSCTVRQP